MTQGRDMRTALVTGGIGGIGTEVCRGLVREGRRVVAGFYPPEQTQAEQWRRGLGDDGYEVEIVPGDVSSFESCREMVETVLSRFHSIDILVNCAGITRDKTLRKMEPDQWEAVIRTNLDSAFNVTRHVIDGMQARRFGRVVNISSVNGQTGQFGQTNYSAAKAGIHGFTMALARETAAKGITVNTVSPGYVDTPMTTGSMDADILDEIVNSIPVGRLGTPGDIARAVVFLTADGNDYITGVNLPVNGGLFMS